MPFELVIFDCDGVLVDSELIANRILAGALGEIGLPITFEETVERFVGRTMSTCLEAVEHDLGRRLPADFVRRVQQRTFDAFERELKPVPGIVEALREIDVPVCVASSGSRRKMEKTLALTGLLPRFSGKLFSATEVAHPKPHPDLFLKAATVMQAQPSRCAVVEDAAPGIEAAVAAGMTAFGYVHLHPSDMLRDAGAAVLFEEMRRLPELLAAHGP